MKNKIKINKKILFKIILVSIFLLGLGIRIYYLSYTKYWQCSYDSWGHKDYINFLANGVVPQQDQCWQCYHPPFYYLLASAIVRISNFLNLEEKTVDLYLQIFSLFLFCMFLIISYFIFKKYFIRNKLFLVLSWSLLVFWPSGIIHSIRIGNDVLFYLISILSFWFLLTWNKKNNKKDLILSILFAILSIYTKSNGLISLFTILIVVMIKEFLIMKNNFYYFLKNEGKILIIALLISIIPLTNNFINFKGWDNKNSSWIISNSNKLPDQLLVGKKIKNFLEFNTEKFFESPFYNPWQDKGGRQFFTVSLIKSSLWGEFRSNDQISIGIGNFVLIILFSMIFLSLTCLFIIEFLFKKNIITNNYILFFYFFISMAALIFMRIKSPFACTNDFRYIFVILVPTIIIYFLILEEFKKKLHLFVAINILLVTSFFLLSLYFFMTGFEGFLFISP